MPCIDCGALIIAARKLCKPCYYRHRRKGTLYQYSTKIRSLEERFLAFYERASLTDKGCLEWPGRKLKGKFNYGIITKENDKGSEPFRAHRISYEIHKGPIPNGKVIMHTCDNPPCVNPLHLFPGTRGQNNRDSKEKGRNARGERQGRSKLKSKDVVEIRLSTKPQYILATKFGVNQGAISKIKKRKSWRHVI